LFSTPVDGQVYSAPTVVGSTLVVATENNHVYGLDAASGAVKWSQYLGEPWHAADLGCNDLAPNIGITSTPAVDASSGTVFVVAKTYVAGSSGPAKYVAAAIDASSGARAWTIDLAGAAANDPNATFQATNLVQRAAPLLMGGTAYFAFAGVCDTPPYRGWVVGISTAGSVATRWTDEAGQPDDSPEGGIWQAAGPITSDRPGQLLVVSGNGNLPPAGPATVGEQTLGMSVVRLAVQGNGSLLPIDSFTPADADSLSAGDQDLGSSNVELLPSDVFGTSTVPNLAVVSSKGGAIYLLDRSFLGGRGQGPSGGDGVPQRVDTGLGMWASPTFWSGDGGFVYETFAFHGLRAYAYGTSEGLPTLTYTGTGDAVGYGSSSPIVTSTGTTNGSALVWIVAKEAGGDELRAYDAVPSNGTMHEVGSWPVGKFAKFNRITVAAGRVYVGTRDGHVLAFGSEGGYVPVTSTRLMDTRSGLGDCSPSPCSTLGAWSTTTLTIGGHASVPTSGARAVVVNVTVANGDADGYVTVWAAGESPPSTSNVNFTAGELISGMAVVQLDAGDAAGQIQIASGPSSVDVMVDVQGYYTADPSAGALNNRVTPTRLLDTRTGLGTCVPGPCTTVPEWGDLKVQIAGGSSPVPVGATAVELNLTSVESAAPGYLSFDPTRQTSNVNFDAGQVRALLVVGTLDPDGSITIHTGPAGSDIVVDVQSWFGASGTAVEPRSPVRVLDTRACLGSCGAITGDGSVTIQLAGTAVPAAATSVYVNITVANPQTAGYVSAYAGDLSDVPLVSNVNFAGGELVSNLAHVELGADGTITFHAGISATDLVVDVVGYS
jgi:outer membrane protein assembly factor BamB